MGKENGLVRSAGEEKRINSNNIHLRVSDFHRTIRGCGHMKSTVRGHLQWPREDSSIDCLPWAGIVLNQTCHVHACVK